MNNANKLDFQFSSWEMEFCDAKKTPVVFRSGKDISISLHGVSFGDISETAAICEKCRRHQPVDFPSTSVETESIVPFGNEPVIKRELEFSSNHVKIVTDIMIKSPLNAKTLQVDNLMLDCGWSELGVVTVKKDFSSAEPVWHNLDSVGDKVQISEIPLILLFKTKDGKTLEIGTGDDLWRWNLSKELGLGNPLFTVEKGRDGVSLTREVLSLPEDSAIPRRDCRFTWYIAWELDDIGKNKLPVRQDDSTFRPLAMPGGIFNFSEESGEMRAMPDESWPQTACSIFQGESTLPCFHSNIVINHLKHWIRCSLPHSLGKPVVLGNVAPALCETPTHFAKKNRELLLHWDMMRIMDFHLWASKQLKYSDSSFHILPHAKGSLFNSLPSMKGLAGTVAAKSGNS